MDDKDKEFLFGRFAKEEKAKEQYIQTKASTLNEPSKTTEEIKVDYAPRATFLFDENILLECLENIKPQTVEKVKEVEVRIKEEPKPEVKAIEEIKEEVQEPSKEQDIFKELSEYIGKTRLNANKQVKLQFASSEDKPKVMKLYKLNQMPIYDLENDLGIPTCFVVHKSTITVGYTSGSIKIMGLDNPNGKVLTHKEVNRKAVISIDINTNGNFLIAAYKPLSLILWDLTKMTAIKHTAINSNEEYLCVRFMNTVKDVVLTSDSSGKINIVEYSKTMFGYNANTSFLKKIDNIVQLLPIDNGYVFFAGSGGVIFASIDPTPKVLWTFSGALNFKNGLPFIGVGRGVVPNEQTSERVLAIAWKNVIQLVIIRDVTNPKGFTQNGYYITEQLIRGIWWLAEGIVIVIYEDNKLQLLDINKFIPGMYTEEEAVRNRVAEIEPALYDPSIKLREDSKSISEVLYYGSFNVKNNRLIELTQNVIVYWGLHSLNDFLIKEAKVNGVYGKLKAIARMYSKGYKGIYDLPEDKITRENTLRPLFRVTLKEFLNEKSDDKSIDPSEISALIELCIETRTFDYLFDELLNFFRESKKEDLYIETLENLILSGIFNDIEAPKEIIESIVNFYIRRGEYCKLESLLIKLNITKKDFEYLSQICIKYKLCLLYIYMKTAGEDKYYFVEPLNLLQEKINELKDTTSLNVSKEFVLNKETESSWTFFAYIMLYYIDNCFKRRMLPKHLNEQVREIPYSMWQKIVYLITNWLFTTQTPKEQKIAEDSIMRSDEKVKKVYNINDLMAVNIDITLTVLKQLFENKELRKVVVDSSKYAELATSTDYIKNYEDILRRLKENISNFEAKSLGGHKYNAFYEFLYQISIYPEITLSAQLCSATIKRISNSKIDFDNQEVIKENEEKMLFLLKKHKDILGKKLEKLREKLRAKRYTRVLLYLMEVTGEYTNCFDNIVNSKNTNISSQIFTWLNSIQHKVKSNIKLFDNMKSIIRSKFKELVIPRLIFNSFK